MGLVIGAPTSALLYLVHVVLIVPFLPFTMFEGITGLMPGGLVSRGIEVMVSVVRRLGLGDTAAAAKQMEQGMAVTAFLLLCSVIGAGAFLAGRTRATHGSRRVGLSAGILLGSLLLVVAFAVDARGVLPAVLGGASWGAGLALAHRALWRTTPRRASEPAIGEERATRRAVIVRIGAGTAVLTFAGVALSRALTRNLGQGGAGVPWSAQNPLPNASAEPSPVPGTRPELTPVDAHYRVDINLIPPRVEESTWRLRFGGQVERERSFTLDELRSMPAIHQFVTLACISNPVGGDLIGTTRWSGVRLSHVLDQVGLHPEATHLRIRSADGFDEIVSIEEARSDGRVMLAYAWDGLPLAVEHGFPLRIYLPDRYGMKQPKWIESIEAISGWEPGYWVRRGWDREARMRATSVIDVVGPDPIRAEDGSARVLIGGIAHAGARGISRVEVRVDGGAWSPAQLRPPLSETTWVIWRYAWPFEPGEHVFEVRCFDGAGSAQLEAPSPPHPSGATGFHSVRKAVG